MESRKVTLRSDTQGENWSSLWAYVDEAGDLRIDGQDLGPATAPVSSDGEYEYFYTITKENIPALVKALGGGETDGILDLLEREWTGEKAREFERMVHAKVVPREFFCYSG